MMLRVYTRTEVLLELEVTHVTAEDPTGSLGIRPGHAPLVTPLVQGILMARSPDGRETYVAVNAGVLLVTGDLIEVTSREAVASNSLTELEKTALGQFELEDQEDRVARTSFEKMRISFMRRVLDFEHAGESL